ncbi:MAG TPA: hypothetical protein VF148_07435 [Acidimicrobiia bacterium]
MISYHAYRGGREGRSRQHVDGYAGTKTRRGLWNVFRATGYAEADR